LDVDEKGAVDVTVQGGRVREPVIVVAVLVCGTVALDDEGFDEVVAGGEVEGERAGSGLNAFDEILAFE
jgi:hypothetical protein